MMLRFQTSTFHLFAIIVIYIYVVTFVEALVLWNLHLKSASHLDYVHLLFDNLMDIYTECYALEIKF